jgi:hypothetical protein
MDVELKKLCKEIYQQNKDIIDLIFSVGNEIDIEPAVLIFTRNYPDIVMISLKSRTFCFALEAFKKGQIQSTDSWGGGFPVYLWFSEYNAKLKITFEVGPFEDFNKRVVFLNKLETSGIKTSERAKEIGRKHTRIYTNTHSIKDWTDNEEIADVMEKLYKEDEIVKMRHLVAQVINEFTW